MTCVLVIDDEPSLRKLVRQMLERAQYEVIEAENGQVGLQLLRSRRPDIVITDIVMPKKEGIETIVEIRREMPGVRIVAMSGGGRTRNLDVLTIARRAGADAVLSKPFETADLLGAVAGLPGGT